MVTFAVLSGAIPKLGVVLVAILLAGALLARERRTSAAAMAGALVLAPVLLLDDIWHSPQLSVVHRHPLLAVAGAAVGLAAVGAASVMIARRPTLLGPLAIFALPFRVPIEAGGTSSNLLVPLYLVVAAGTLAFIVPALHSRASSGAEGREGPWEAGSPSPGGASTPDAARWIERLLALSVVLYAVQSVYSSDFEKALQQMVFFYVPFALLFCLLRMLRWTPRLLRTCLQVVVGLALVFAAVGFVEYATKSILLNPKLIAANDLHAYFTVNSVFFDPDIFGRFLALVMITVAVLLLYERESREQVAATAVLAILWGALVLTLSRSSLGALLVGLGMLAALRWNAWRAVVVGVVVVAIGAAALAVSPNTFGLNQGLNGASSGRANLVTGGISLFGDRPVWGYGSGSFVQAYRAHHPRSSQTLSASHTIPVTVAAEQGVIGELVYLALVLVAVVVLVRGARSDPPRAAIAAAFVALVFHTLLYADFLEDPITWTLLGIGGALAVASRTEPEPEPETEPTTARAGRAAPVPA